MVAELTSMAYGFGIEGDGRLTEGTRASALGCTQARCSAQRVDAVTLIDGGDFVWFMRVAD
jgi:hypothetical protein